MYEKDMQKTQVAPEPCRRTEGTGCSGAGGEGWVGYDSGSSSDGYKNAEEGSLWHGLGKDD